MAAFRDWFALREEFMGWGQSMREFSKHKKIPLRTLFTRYSKEGWEEQRQQLRAKAATEARAKIVDRMSTINADLFETWLAMLSKVRMHLREGSTPNEMKAGRLKLLSATLDQATKNMRLLSGESTDNVRKIEDPEFEEIKDDPVKLAVAIERELSQVAQVRKALSPGDGQG